MATASRNTSTVGRFGDRFNLEANLGVSTKCFTELTLSFWLEPSDATTKAEERFFRPKDKGLNYSAGALQVELCYYT
jgi:hypothetical protein